MIATMAAHLACTGARSATSHRTSTTVSPQGPEVLRRQLAVLARNGTPKGATKRKLSYHNKLHFQNVQARRTPGGAEVHFLRASFCTPRLRVMPFLLPSSHPPLRIERVPP